MSCVRRHTTRWPLQAGEEHLISILIGPISDTALIQHILCRPYLCVLPSYFLSPRLRWRIFIIICIVFWPLAPIDTVPIRDPNCIQEKCKKSDEASCCKQPQAMCCVAIKREVWGSTETYLVRGRHLFDTDLKFSSRFQLYLSFVIFSSAFWCVVYGSCKGVWDVCFLPI